jgi:hypothetical protein
MVKRFVNDRVRREAAERVIAWSVGALVVLRSCTRTAEQSDRERDIGRHNAVRARAGVPPLTWSKRLESAARQWAESLLAKGTFIHRPQSDFGENLFEIRGARADANARRSQLGRGGGQIFQSRHKLLPRRRRVRPLHSDGLARY